MPGLAAENSCCGIAISACGTRKPCCASDCAPSTARWSSVLQRLRIRAGVSNAPAGRRRRHLGPFGRPRSQRACPHGRETGSPLPATRPRQGPICWLKPGGRCGPAGPVYGASGVLRVVGSTLVGETLAALLLLYATELDAISQCYSTDGSKFIIKFNHACLAWSIAMACHISTPFAVLE